MINSGKIALRSAPDKIVKMCEGNSPKNKCLRSLLNTIDNQFFSTIVKDSSADLGVNFKIVQIRPTVKAVSSKISKKNFCIFVNILIFLRENKEASFFLF